MHEGLEKEIIWWETSVILTKILKNHDADSKIQRFRTNIFRDDKNIKKFRKQMDTY